MTEETHRPREALSEASPGIMRSAKLGLLSEPVIASAARFKINIPAEFEVGTSLESEKGFQATSVHFLQRLPMTAILAGVKEDFLKGFAEKTGEKTAEGLWDWIAGLFGGSSGPAVDARDKGVLEAGTYTFHLTATTSPGRDCFVRYRIYTEYTDSEGERKSEALKEGQYTLNKDTGKGREDPPGINVEKKGSDQLLIVLQEIYCDGELVYKSVDVWDVVRDKD